MGKDWWGEEFKPSSCSPMGPSLDWGPTRLLFMSEKSSLNLQSCLARRASGTYTGASAWVDCLHNLVLVYFGSHCHRKVCIGLQPLSSQETLYVHQSARDQKRMAGLGCRSNAASWGNVCRKEETQALLEVSAGQPALPLIALPSCKGFQGQQNQVKILLLHTILGCKMWGTFCALSH